MRVEPIAIRAVFIRVEERDGWDDVFRLGSDEVISIPPLGLVSLFRVSRGALLLEVH